MSTIGYPLKPLGLPTVTLAVLNNPVPEGEYPRVRVRLSRTLASDVTIPLTVTAGSAESGDYDVISPGIRLDAGLLEVASRTIVETSDDDDQDDETFTIALGTLPATVTAGSPSSVTVTIADDDTSHVLGVEATPACGATVSDLSVVPNYHLRLAQATGAAVETEMRWVADNAGNWLGATPILSGGRQAGLYRDNSFADLRRAYPGFTGFEFRLKDHTGVTARCTWQFDDGTRAHWGDTLVSNLLNVSSNAQTNTASNAQGFTTGDSGLGYILENVAAILTSTRALTASERSRIKVQLWSSTNNGGPASKITDLTVPSSAGNAGSELVPFAAPPDTLLRPETTYHLVLFTTGSRIGNGQTFRLPRKAGDDEDDGAARGWSIGDNSHWSRTGSNPPTGSTTWTSFGQSLKIRVTGSTVPVLIVSNLRVTRGNYQLTLRWTAPVPAAFERILGYDVQFKRSDAGENDWIQHGGELIPGLTTNTLTTRVINLGLIPPTDVHVRVRPRYYKDDGPITGIIKGAWVTWQSTASRASGGTTGGGTSRLQTGAQGGGGDTPNHQSGAGDGGGGNQPEVVGTSGGGYADLIDQIYEWRNDPQWASYKSHTDRWDRALKAFGETVSDDSLEAMTAAEAQAFADSGMTRWVEVAEALREIEADDAPEPPDLGQPVEDRQLTPPALHGDLLAQMDGWRNDPQWVSHKSHTDRWDRALLAFGEPVSDTSLSPMTDAEAQDLADTAWGTRWVGVAAALNIVVTGTSGADTLTGTSDGELLAGLGGADTLSGLGGNDELRGGDGNDDLSGGGGADRFVFFSGETGANAITDFESGDVIVLKGSGWSSVANIIATVDGVGSTGYSYTLATGLTVEMTNNRPLRTEDFVTD